MRSNKNNRRLIKLVLKPYILLLAALISCNNSNDSEVRNQTLSEISQFYFKNKSIEIGLNEENSLPEQRDQKSKEIFIMINRVSLELDKNWVFVSQDYDVANVSPFKAIIEIRTYFKKNDLIARRSETFYYDINEDDIFFNYPIPIEDKGEIIEADRIIEIYTRQVWHGEFNDLIEDLYN